MTRLVTTVADLARRGFSSPAQAVKDLAVLLDADPELCAADDADQRWLARIDAAADPDLALASLARLADSGDLHLRRLIEDEAALHRLICVLGASTALAHHLVTHPGDVASVQDDPRRWSPDEISADLLAVVGAADAGDRAHPEVHDPDGTLSQAADRLRLANKRHLVRIAARDLAAVEPEWVFPDIAAELADLADGIVQAALTLARAEVDQSGEVRLAVVALGKCGAQELNYISDVDVLYVAEPARDDVPPDRVTAIGTKLAAAIARTCSAHTSAGTIWTVDAGLRPEGRAGPLVRSLASMQRYYETWAKNWEFQAMLKARPMAGDLELGQQFCDLVGPLVWQAGGRENFMSETQAMRQRVISLLPGKEVNRDIKLGPGGLRDTEFSVQLLQLVHGRVDERVRLRGTVQGLDALVAGGYIGRADGQQLGHAYRFQRVLEHRVQLLRLRRTHLLPDGEADLRRLARQLGMRDGPDEVVEQWRTSARRVQRLQQRMVYSPLLQAVSRISSDELRLTPEAAQDRLRALGFGDPLAAMRHIEALTQGVNRAAAIQRQLMPAMLGWLAEAPSPDAGLLAFRQVSEQLGTTPWYLRALRDEGEMAHRLARIVSSSRYVVDLLKRAPETVQLLADDAELEPRPLTELLSSMTKTLSRHPEQDDAVAAVRAIRRRELFRIAVADLLGVIDLEAVGAALSDLASATLDAVLEVSARDEADAPRIGVVAMGRWGGREMGYGSDVDALFIVSDSDDPTALTKAGRIVARLRSLLSAPGPDPALEVDAGLRPEGKGGPMVRSLSSYRAYYEKWSDTWEAQALVRASHGAGERDVTGALLSAVDRLRYPDEGLTRKQLAEIRRLKGRMESERIPRGRAPKRNVKLGPGGLSDVEWTVQVLQMQHAHEHPELRTTGTETALRAAVEVGLVRAADADILTTAWRRASGIRNAMMLVRGRASDTLPTDAQDVAAIAVLLGHGHGCSGELLEQYARDTRHAAGVVDRLFWGAS